MLIQPCCKYHMIIVILQNQTCTAKSSSIVKASSHMELESSWNSALYFFKLTEFVFQFPITTHSHTLVFDLQLVSMRSRAVDLGHGTDRVVSLEHKLLLQPFDLIDHLNVVAQMARFY
ncbi:hypothetical protein NE237_000933 [Protea cynaroides]|uniref:Uncharacterized protein n=1 Tax=Protea cynaroides TaxID=273540 RepID=A0A9Q0KSC2_9MAGN|nr:hypothetical protein NE237_000933 [Protea cynaroides]